MTHRTMYDSTDPRLFPADAEVIAYYPYAWGSDLSRVKSAIEVRIVNMNDGKLHADDCHAIDVESGAASIQDAVNFVDTWNHLHAATGGMHTANGWIRKPIVYISEARVSALRNALAGRDFDLWVAWWGIGPTDVPGAFAHQYTNRGPHGENYDISVVSDDTWGLPPTPPQPPAGGQTYQGIIVYPVGGRLATKAVTSTDSGVNWS